MLIVPGDHFGMDGYLRIGFGDEVGYLREGLNRLHELHCELDIADSGCADFARHRIHSATSHADPQSAIRMHDPT